MNDFVNLDKEIKSPILKKYLTENNYSQNLISRQKEIDGMLVNYVEVEWEKERERREKERERREKVKREREWLSENPAIRIIKLRNLRTMINLIPNSSAPTHPPIFREILLKSKYAYAIRMFIFDCVGTRGDIFLSKSNGKSYRIQNMQIPRGFSNWDIM